MRPHLIRKQIIELRLPDRAEHFRWQQEISDRFWNEIKPALEKAFDLLHPGEEVLQVDRLQIDLGRITEKEMRAGSWSPEIHRKIIDGVRALGDPASKQYAGKPVMKTQAAWEQWLSYMERGVLPWNSPRPDDAWRELVLEQLAVSYPALQALRKKTRDNPAIVSRIVAGHADSFLLRLCEIVCAARLDELQEVFVEWFDPAAVGNSANRRQKKNAWADVLKEILHTSPVPAVTTLVEQVRRLSSEDGHIGRQIPATVANDRADQGTGPDRALEGDGVYLVNAGVILLHPFLKTFFSRLALTAGNAFENSYKQSLAIHLLHYLATGSILPAEHDLVLPKLLCGYPVEELPGEVTLSPEMIQEADDLLLAAIAQWDKLQQASPAALREGFLQRPGKIFSGAGRVHLQVEKSAIDILLDYLPWNLGLVTLPWRREMIHVDWR